MEKFSFAITMLVLATGCSQAPMPPGIPDIVDGGDAKTSADGSVVSCFADDAGCTKLQGCGAKVFVVEVASDPPTPAGGVVANGTYVLDSYQVFTGSGGASGQLPVWFNQTMKLTNDLVGDAGGFQSMIWEEISETSSSPEPQGASGSASVQQTPNAIFFDGVCNDAGAGFSGTFSATDAGLLVYTTDPRGTAELGYAKQ